MSTVHIEFTEAQMILFLRKKHYKIAHWPVEQIDENGYERKASILVAVSKKDREVISNLFYESDIKPQFGIENVFKKEIANAMIKFL